MSKQKLKIGKIINTHGIRGEVKILRITDFEERFTPGNEVIIAADQGDITLTIDSHRIHKGFDLITFKGYTNINKVEQWKGLNLFIDKNQATELEEDAYYYHEIIGCQVQTTEGETLGKVKEILSPGANDVWVVQRPGKKDLLLPYIEDVIKKVDTDTGIISVELMEGMLD
ncbi:ribosome maturation factor RimM [Oceanobacillus sp. J11TS1]|uniref:ribosome maturation factor RimM n=1 Tax=Oceanobacillus sp. J11TS1 TaxID=2807191 RepID=UPI001B250542|nr:ribosome maturation factor RimM [Oceanobacillus sp. J11TS1]GIO21945.1 ribosome maturation factor RimM [Oceanobacillus sp. J11TS1]